MSLCFQRHQVASFILIVIDSFYKGPRDLLESSALCGPLSLHESWTQ